MIYKGYTAEEYTFKFINAKAVIDFSLDEYTFVDDSGSYFLNVYDEREGRELKYYTTQITNSSDTLILNTSVEDMTFEDLGTYYYELGYVRSGGYEELLRFGKFIVI